MVQSRIVSAKTSNIPHTPCSAGLLQFDTAWAAGAVPHPASFETIPLITPNRTAPDRKYPPIPDTAASAENAFLNISANASPKLSSLRAKTAKDMAIYPTVMIGTSASVSFNIPFVPNKSADCYNDGMSEHYKCDLCSAFFDTDGNVISADELIISASHIFGELVSARAPTCVSQGNRAYYHCSVCNKNFDESHEPLNEIYIPATGIHSGGIATCTTLAICDRCNNAYGEAAPYNHSFASSYTYSSSKHWHACICGEKSGTEEHSYTEKITKPATETEEGTKELSCVCGYVVEENIPMLEGAPSPKPTPDSSLPKQKSISAWIWIPISLSAIIVLGLAFVLIRHKNKKRKD